MDKRNLDIQFGIMEKLLIHNMYNQFVLHILCQICDCAKISNFKLHCMIHTWNERGKNNEFTSPAVLVKKKIIIIKYNSHDELWF